MLPLLDGGAVSVRVGESLIVRLMGRDGYLTLTSPQGFVDKLFVKDGLPKVLKKFTVEDVGEWVLSTDDGQNLTVVVERPVYKPSLTVNVRLEGSAVVMTVSTPPQTYAFFIEAQGGNNVFTPNSVIQLELEDVNATLLRFDLLRKTNRLKYGGRLQGTPYYVEIDQLVMSQVIRGRRHGDAMSFAVTLPAEGAAGPSGLRVLSYGQHIVRLISLEGNRVVYEGEITIVPEKINRIKGLTRTVKMDFWDAFGKNYTLVVGDELGNVWFLSLVPPLAVLKVFDNFHNQLVGEYKLLLDNSSTYKMGEQTILAFINSLAITSYDNGSVIKPTRTADVRLEFEGAVVDLTSVEMRPGESYTLDVRLQSLLIRLVYPNGTIHQGQRTVDINGRVIVDNGERSLFLPSGTYVIKAVSPESFSPITYRLTSDTTVTVIVLDNPVGLASLRISAILMAALLGYSAYKLWSIRKTFYQASNK